MFSNLPKLFKDQGKVEMEGIKNYMGKNHGSLLLKWISSLLILSYTWRDKYWITSGKVLHDLTIYNEIVFLFENHSLSVCLKSKPFVDKVCSWCPWCCRVCWWVAQNLIYLSGIYLGYSHGGSFLNTVLSLCSGMFKLYNITYLLNL